MKTLLGKLFGSVALAFGMSVTAHAALLIDDFGALAPGQGPDQSCTNCVNPPVPSADHTSNAPFTWSYIAVDSTVGGGGAATTANPIYNGSNFQNNMVVLRPDPPGPPDEVDNPRNWTREIGAELRASDSVAAEICYNCQAGHHVSGAGGGDGDTYFEYLAGSAVDATAAGSVNRVSLQYAADQGPDPGDVGDGADITFTFNSPGAVHSETIFDLENTGNSNPSNYRTISLPLAPFLAAGVDFTNLTSARIDIVGVPDLDMTIDNFQLVPEPELLMLFGLGLAGLGWQARRRRV